MPHLVRGPGRSNWTSFYITLERRHDEQSRLLTLLSKEPGLQRRIRRVESVDHHELDEMRARKLELQGVIQEGTASLLASQNGNAQDGYDSNSQFLTRRAVAHALAHMQAWQRLVAMAAEGIQWALVIEDGVTDVCPNFLVRLQETLSCLPPDFDFCYIACHGSSLLGEAVHLDVEQCGSSPKPTVSGTFAYLISTTGAQKLLGLSSRRWAILPLASRLDSALSQVLGDLSAWRVMERNGSRFPATLLSCIPEGTSHMRSDQLFCSNSETSNRLHDSELNETPLPWQGLQDFCAILRKLATPSVRSPVHANVLSCKNVVIDTPVGSRLENECLKACVETVTRKVVLLSNDSDMQVSGKEHEARDHTETPNNYERRTDNDIKVLNGEGSTTAGVETTARRVVLLPDDLDTQGSVNEHEVRDQTETATQHEERTDNHSKVLNGVGSSTACIQTTVRKVALLRDESDTQGAGTGHEARDHQEPADQHEERTDNHSEAQKRMLLEVVSRISAATEPCDVLNVAHDANDATLHKAWRKLVLILHPDKLSGCTTEERAAAAKALDAVHRAREDFRESAQASGCVDVPEQLCMAGRPVCTRSQPGQRRFEIQWQLPEVVDKLRPIEKYEVYGPHIFSHDGEPMEWILLATLPKLQGCFIFVEECPTQQEVMWAGDRMRVPSIPFDGIRRQRAGSIRAFIYSLVLAEELRLASGAPIGDVPPVLHSSARPLKQGGKNAVCGL